MHQLSLLILATILVFPILAFSKGVDPDNNSITFSLRQEPPNLDSSLSEDTTSGQMLRLMNEGLVNINQRGQVLPGVAKEWHMDVMQVTFVLRDDARWSNGEPVTAGDFVYAWRRLVNPQTAARGSTLFAHLIDNADAIMTGELPVEALGVSAIDDHTLQVNLSQPASYFIYIVAGSAYFPLNQAFVEQQGDRYAADAKNLLSNGPFQLDQWTHSARLEFSKNPYYWGKDDISLDSLNVGYITADARSLLNLYNSNEIAELELGEEILKEAVNNNLRIHKSPRNCIAWITLNMRSDRLTADRRIREAIRLSIDRDSYVNNIVAIPGTRKIDSPFTRQMRGVERSFQQEYPAPSIDFDLARARALVEEVRQERTSLPPLVLLANETRQIEAEFIQGQLITKLGLDVKVDKQTFKQAIEKQRRGDYDLTRVGYCGGVVTDPIVYASVFESDGPYNDAGYSSPAYDEQLTVSRTAIDPLQRMAAFDAMQKILYNDIPLIPTHQYAFVYLQDEKLASLQRYPLIDFSKGYIR